jgi:hypothetical protein
MQSAEMPTATAFLGAPQPRHETRLWGWSAQEPPADGVARTLLLPEPPAPARRRRDLTSPLALAQGEREQPPRSTPRTGSWVGPAWRRLAPIAILAAGIALGFAAVMALA